MRGLEERRTAEPQAPAQGTERRTLREHLRPTAAAVYAGGFLLLLAAAAAAALAHFTASGIAPWLSLACSAGAMACTVAALWMSRRR